MAKPKRAQVNTRTTVVVPEALDRNLALWCAKTGSTKSDIITRLLSDFLSSEGFQPHRRPRTVEVQY